MVKNKEPPIPTNKNEASPSISNVKTPPLKNEIPTTQQEPLQKPAEASNGKAESKPKSELELAREEAINLRNQVKKITDELQEWKEKYVYLQAEFDNAEKRRAKAMDSYKKRMQADIIFAFLPLVDSFIPAIKKVDEGAYKDVKSLGEGLKTLKQQLDNILKGLNVTPIDQVNIPFDYNLHEVTVSQERPDLPDETVLSIVQVGWKLGNDVIRPAKVVVSKKPTLPSPGDAKVADMTQAKVAPPDAENKNSTESQKKT